MALVRFPGRCTSDCSRGLKFALLFFAEPPAVQSTSSLYGVITIICELKAVKNILTEYGVRRQNTEHYSVDRRQSLRPPPVLIRSAIVMKMPRDERSVDKKDADCKPQFPSLCSSGQQDVRLLAHGN